MSTTNEQPAQMQRESHTPGPWIVDEVATPNGVGYFINHLWNEDDASDNTHTDEIAEVVMNYKGGTALANARLLAAAPELLDACQKAMSIESKIGANDATLGRNDYLIDLLQTAIAKAVQS